MKTIFRRKKRNDADLLSFETAVENLKPKWRKHQEDALDKSAEDQQEVYRQMKQEFDELRRRHGITAEIQPPIFQFKIKDTTEQQNKINQDLMKNIRADGLLVPFNGTTVHDLEKWITQTLTMLKTIALTEERIPLTMKIAKNYLNKLIPDGYRFDNIMKRAWTDKNDDIEQIFKKMIHILHSTGIAENEKCKLSTPIQGQDESVMTYSKRFEEYHKQLEGTDEFNRLIHADTISTRLYVLLLKGLNNSIKKHLPIPGLQKLIYEEVIEKLTEVENTALIFGDNNHVNAINNSRQFNKKFFNKNNRQYKPRYNTNSSNHKETTSNGNTYEKKNKTNFNKRKPNTNYKSNKYTNSRRNYMNNIESTNAKLDEACNQLRELTFVIKNAFTICILIFCFCLPLAGATNTTCLTEPKNFKLLYKNFRNFVKDDALPMQIYRIPNNCILTDPSVYVKIHSIYINDKDSSELQLHNTEALCDTTKVFEDLNGNKYGVVPIATNSYKVSAVKRASHYLEYFNNFESVEKCPEIIEISDHPSVKIEPIIPSQPPAASINQTVLRKRPPIEHKDDAVVKIRKSTEDELARCEDEKSQLKEVLSKLELEKEQWLRDKALLERTIQEQNAKHESVRFDLQSQIDQKDKDIKTLNNRIIDYQSSISEKSQQLRNFQQQLQSLSSSVKANDPKDLMEKVTNLENFMNNFKCPTIPTLSCPPCDLKNVNANINNLKQRTPTDLDKRISGIEYSMSKLEHAINSYSPSIDVRPEIDGLHAAISEIPTLMKQLKEEQVENKHSNSTTSVTCHCANSPDLTEWLTNIPKKGIEDTMTGMPSSIVAIISIILTLLTKNGLHHLRNRFNSHPSTTREEAPLYIVDDSPKYRSIHVRTDEEMEINEILHEASPIITLDIGTTCLDTLIDTGANLNVIHWNSFQQISDKYKSEIRTTTQRARAANGQAMKFEGEVDVYLTIGNRHVAVPTLISKEINHDFIIGRQTLKEMGDSTLFNWKRGRIEFGDQFYDIKNSSKVYSKKKIRLPPYSSNIIHCGLQTKDFPYENGYFIVNDDFRKDNLLLTCNQLGNIHENMYAVLIINMGNNPVTLPKNKQIGRIAGIVAETDNSVTIKGEELIPDGGDWEENLPPYPVNKILSDNELLSLINWKECNLSKRNIEKLKKIVLKYNLAFHEYDGKIGRYKGKEKLTIRLKDNNSLPKPIRAQQLSREKEAEIERQIKQMIEEDMIEPSRSPYLSRVVLVKKKDSNWRFVVDFRRINSLVEAQSHHIPKIQNILNEAAGKRFYSTFDLKSGFHQIALDASSRKLASFVTHQGIFSYKVMPMGLTGSPDAFQRIMETVLFGLVNTFVYIDDILTASDNEEEHLENIEAILKRIQDNGMKISLKKSSFGLLQINYLGYTIDFHGIKPNQDKISALEKKQTPKTAKEVKSFMGAASYFRRHIPNFARIAEPLYRVTNEFIWTAAQETAFQNIKKALINAACLKKPDSRGKYEIQTDASNQGIGAVLIQENRPVAFISRSLTKSEKNYPPIKLEAIALIYALRTFRSYIYGKQTQVYTDHKPLLALIKNKNLKGILERFQLAIMEYDVKIDYVKGPDNHMADYLSRETFNLIAALDAAFPVMQQPYDTPYNIKNFIHYYTAEDNFKYDGKPLVTVRNKNRFYVPETLRGELLTRYHKHPLLGSHFGYQKCAEYFQRIFYWPEMIKDMKSVWENCSECLANKEQPNRKIAVVKKHLERPNEIFKTLSIDYGVIEEGKYVLAVVDEFTKFAQVAITTNQGALTTTTELMKMFCNFGFPQTIRSDNGPTFKSTKFVAFLKELGIQHLTSSAHHHKGNSIAERFIRTIRERLRFYDVSNNTIYMCAFAHNNMKHTTTNMSPMSLILNTKPHPITGSPIHAKLSGMLDLFKTTTPQEQVTNANLLQEGEKVWKRIINTRTTKQKNTPQYDGPYIVVKHIYGDTYVIRKITGKGRMTGQELKVNAEMLKKESNSN